jgi:negative regulator of replication initiation
MVKKITTVSIDSEDYLYIKQFAESKGLSFSDVVRLLLKEQIAQRKAIKTSQTPKQS